METANTFGCDLAAEVAGTFGCVCLRVSGTCMAPTIRPGDLVSAEPASVMEVSPGRVARPFNSSLRIKAYDGMILSEL